MCFSLLCSELKTRRWIGWKNKICHDLSTLILIWLLWRGEKFMTWKTIFQLIIIISTPVLYFHWKTRIYFFFSYILLLSSSSHKKSKNLLLLTKDLDGRKKNKETKVESLKAMEKITHSFDVIPFESFHLSHFSVCRFFSTCCHEVIFVIFSLLCKISFHIMARQTDSVDTNSLLIVQLSWMRERERMRERKTFFYLESNLELISVASIS